MATMKKRDTKNGVTITAWTGHPSYKWRVSYPDGDKRKSKGFRAKTGEDGAATFADGKRKEVDELGKKHGTITDAERRAVIAFREMVDELPDGIRKPTLANAVDLLRDTLGVRHKSKTVCQLVDDYLLNLQRKGVSDSYQYTIKGRLTRFEKDHGDWLACDVSGEVITDWLADMSLAPLTTNHYRTALYQLFKHGLELEIVEKNPVAKVAKKKAKGSEIGILKPNQVAALLENATSEILPGLALGFFAGVRRAELGRLTWEEIDFEQGHIEIKASQSKTAARRLIKMRPALREWLLPHRKHTGAIMPSEMIWRTRLKDAMKAARIKAWPHNAPRHSFASYHLAKFQDAAALALEMGHGSTKMIFEHYRALVTPKIGETYWNIMPSKGEKITNIKSA